MATRPIFIPTIQAPYFREKELDFTWFPGFATSQARKSIASLHEAAAKNGITPVLEISSKSETECGIAASAFNVMVTRFGPPMSVECAYQGSKVFENGGPYQELYATTSREARTDERLRASGKIIGFRFLERDFPTTPKSGFYTWLYYCGLLDTPKLTSTFLEYQAFSDIKFNPDRSASCQARAAAIYVGLVKAGIDIEQLVAEPKRLFAALQVDQLDVGDPE